MCLAIPIKITELNKDNTAYGILGNVRTKINISLIDNVAVGNYVIVHVGFAIQKLSKIEAKKTLSLLKEWNI